MSERDQYCNLIVEFNFDQCQEQQQSRILSNRTEKYPQVFNIWNKLYLSSNFIYILFKKLKINLKLKLLNLNIYHFFFTPTNTERKKVTFHTQWEFWLGIC